MRGVLGLDPDDPDGPLYDGEGWIKAGKRGRDAMCRLCEEPLHVSGDAAPEVRTHFSHYPNSACPSRRGRADPFAGMDAPPRGEGAGERLRAEVLVRCHEMFLNCKSLAPGLSVAEFKALVRAADSKAVWTYQGMTLRFVPYVLVLCAPAFEVRKPYRRESFFFVFEKRVPRLDALWNERGAASAYGLWRVYPKDRTFEFEPIRAGGLWDPEWVSECRRELAR